MDTCTKWLSVFCLFLQMGLAQADTQKTINYENQREEIFDLENWLKKTEYKNEEVKDTCHRKVPYEEQVCKDVTKYKKECTTIPEGEECKNVNHPICHTETHYKQECTRPTRRECHNESYPDCHTETRYENVCRTTPDRQDCNTTYERECRTETRYENQCRTVPGEPVCRVVVRYRQECDNVPGGRQCRQIPPDIRCRVINGENRCEKIPGREECTDAPSRRECRQVPYEERECSPGSSRQECHQVPRQEQVCENVPRQQCRTIPGRYECEQVPRQEQVCETRTRPVCEDVPGPEICRSVPVQEEVCEDHYQRECRTIPAHEVCKNVPYKEQVCKMETKYKDEAYECTRTVKVPHEVVVKTHKAHVQMEFDAKASNVESQFDISLDTKGELQMRLKAREDSDLIAFLTKKITNEDIAGVNSISALYKLSLYNRSENFKFVETGIQNVILHRKSLEFQIDGQIDAKRASLDFRITKKGKVKFEKAISGDQVNMEFDGEKTKVIIDLEKLGAPKLKGFFNKTHNLFLKLKLNYADLGEVLPTNHKKELSTETNLDVELEKD